MAWALSAASLAMVAIVIVAVDRIHGRGGSRTQAIHEGGPGLAGPVLRSGQAWFVVSIEQNTTPWQPPSTFNVSVPPPTVVNAATRAAVVSRAQFEDWTLISGDGRGDGRLVGSPRFIGSAADRALWRSLGSHPLVQLATGVSTTSASGFAVGDHTFSFSQLLRFPTDPAAVLRLFPAPRLLTVPNQVSEIASALESVPFPPAARIALFDAIANLRGVQHLGRVRDPLGRPGTAFATTTPPEPLPPTGPGSTAGAPLPVRNELIFDATTKALLASETVLLKPSPVRGIGTGYPISWTAYVVSTTVPSSEVPTITPPPCPTGAVQLGLGPEVSRSPAITPTSSC